MKTLALTEDGDLLFENGDFKIVENEEEVAQCIEISMKTNLGEWFLNESIGMEQNRLLEKTSNEEARAEVMRMLSQEERIEVINYIEIKNNKKTRIRAIFFDVTLIGGMNITREVTLDA